MDIPVAREPFACHAPDQWGLPRHRPRLSRRPGTHTVTYDQYSVQVDGKPLYIWGAEFHYFRLPSPDAWRDVLQKIKAGGFNAVSLYFDWGYHSAKPGSYDFTGTRDVERLLDEAERAGLYVIARPGPYINAEVSGGGMPAWRKTQAGVNRTSEPEYMKAAREWMSRINPIIARHQLTRGTGNRDSLSGRERVPGRPSGRRLHADPHRLGEGRRHRRAHLRQ